MTVVLGKRKDLFTCMLSEVPSRERGKCWNWRTSRYVPKGTRRKESFHTCLQERGGSVGNGGCRAMNICAYLARKKEKPRI